MKTCYRALVAAWLLMMAASIGFSEDRPVVFLHGLKSSDAAWADTAARLEAALAIKAYRSNTSWGDVYQTQASQVQAALGSLPSNTVAVGHSNGGIVAREWSKTHPLDTLVTLGTPNTGAPLAGNMLNWIGYNYAAGDAIATVFGTVGRCVSHGCGWGSVLSYQSIGDFLSWIRIILDGSVGAAVSTVGVATSAPVLPQMPPGSSYLRDLNSSASVAREQNAIPNRVAIVVSAHNFYDAGAFRLVWPEWGDYIDYWKDATVLGLDYLSAYISTHADFGDWDAYDIADSMASAANWIASLDQRWCEAVTSYIGSGVCGYNDEVVPVENQMLPGAPYYWVKDGPTHTQEIQNAENYVAEALRTVGHIPNRSSNPPPPPPAGGPTLQGDSVVRGCTNYVEQPPVYQSSAAGCANYCQQNGANACEWYQDGSCFVEFGSGCYLQNGFGGWSSAVLSNGGSGGSSEGGNTGGGSGGPQMQADSAIRGCSGYVEYPPVYQPTANACLDYCVQGGGDACEWYSDGSCFLEQGSGCHTEAGFTNWSSAVIH